VVDTRRSNLPPNVCSFIYIFDQAIRFPIVKPEVDGNVDEEADNIFRRMRSRLLLQFASECKRFADSVYIFS